MRLPVTMRLVQPLALVGGLVSFCCSYSYTRDKTSYVEVKANIPASAKVRVAQAVASPRGLESLRAAARAKFGDNAQAWVDGMRLEWQTIHFVAGAEAGSDRVSVVLHVPVAGDAKRAIEIAEYCTSELRSLLAEELAKELGARSTAYERPQRALG